MQALLLHTGIHWQTAAWIAIGAVAALGLLAVVSPRRFSAVASRGGQWVDTNKLFAVLDTRYDIDAKVLPYSRWLGVAVLVSVVVLAYFLIRL